MGVCLGGWGWGVRREGGRGERGRGWKGLGKGNCEDLIKGRVIHFFLSSLHFFISICLKVRKPRISSSTFLEDVHISPIICPSHSYENEYMNKLKNNNNNKFLKLAHNPPQLPSKSINIFLEYLSCCSDFHVYLQAWLRRRR